MKYKAKLELDLTSSDLFEAEVQKAIRAYAKSVARTAMKDEIKEAIEDAAKSWAKRLYEGRYTQPVSDQMVRDITLDVIKDQLFQTDIIDIVQKSTNEAIVKQRKEFQEYVAEEFKKQISGGFVAGLIRDEIQKQIPNAVFETLRAKA